MAYAPAHTGLWALKYLSVAFLISWFMFEGNRFFNKLANWCRLLSFFWLCMQSLLIIEVSFQVNDILVAAVSTCAPVWVLRQFGRAVIHSRSL